MPRTRKSRSHLALGLALFLTQACVHAAGEGAGHRQTVRLLTVGNSFSTDATRFLGDLARAGGHVLVHHEVAIPGGTLSQHWEKAERNRQDPSRPEGLYETGVSLRQELRAEPWDFVTIQQASKLSHDASTYRPYASLLHHLIHENARGAEILVHETWAYRVDDRRFVGKAEPGEPTTQPQMYEGLSRAYATIAGELGARLIPVGDAFHLADTDPRWSYHADHAFDFAGARPPRLPDQTHSLHLGWTWEKSEQGPDLQLELDARHLSPAGRYLAACVFYEILFQESVVGNSFVPAEIDATYARFLQETAHRAVTARVATYPK